MSDSVNPMMEPRITKVSINIGVGEGGDRLVNAESVLEMVTGVKPQRTVGKIQNRDLKVRLGAPIGCKATIRDSEKITQFLTDEKLITLSHQDLTDIKASIDELDNPNKTFDFVPNTNYKAQLDDDKFKPRVATVTDEDDNEHYLLYVDYATPKQHTNLRLKLKRS